WVIRPTRCLKHRRRFASSNEPAKPSRQLAINMTDTQQDFGIASRVTLDRNRDSPLTAELVVRRLIDEGFSQCALDVCDELIADAIMEHQDYGPGHPPGAAGVKAVVTSLHRAFSDFKLEIEEMVVAGDTVWTRNVATGTHDGPYMGHA